MGADNHPTVVPENYEADGDDDGMYSIGEAVRYVKEAAPEDAREVRVSCGEDLAFKWEGMNRIEVWTHLLEHGWVTTSMSSGHVYFERIDRIDY